MTVSPRYAIIANPISGTLSPGRRLSLLEKAAAVLDAEVYGLDTTSGADLQRCMREQARRCDVLVVAGGDGTFSLAVNTIDPAFTALAFLPFGTGNALTHALGYRGGLTDIARRIHAGTFHHYDLIDCEGRKKAFMASLGIDSTAIHLFDGYRAAGAGGLRAHVRAGARALFRDYRPAGFQADLDGSTWHGTRLLSLMAVKQPFLGMGLKAVPKARWDDGLLHVQTITSGTAGAMAALATGFTIGNRAGTYRCGRTLTVSLDAPLTLQTDGDLAWTADRFTFSSLPGALTLKH